MKCSFLVNSQGQHSVVEHNFYRVARYISVVLKNMEKIDSAKTSFFNQELNLEQLFSSVDCKHKGYLDELDFKKLIADNGADSKVFNMEKIMRYFGGHKISLGQFFKAIALPPWKIVIKNTMLISGRSLNSKAQIQRGHDKVRESDNRKKSIHLKPLFKLILAVYLAADQQDTERQKMKVVDLDCVFKGLSSDGQNLRADEISNFLHEKKHPRADAMNLVRFMHNKFSLTFEQFSSLFLNNVPSRFQIASSNYTQSTSQIPSNLRIPTAITETLITNKQFKLQKKNTTETEISDDYNLKKPSLQHDNSFTLTDGKIKKDDPIKRSFMFQNSESQLRSLLPPALFKAKTTERQDQRTSILRQNEGLLAVDRKTSQLTRHLREKSGQKLGRDTSANKKKESKTPTKMSFLDAMVNMGQK